MLGTRDLALFIVSGLLRNISPGPDSPHIASCKLKASAAVGQWLNRGIGALFLFLGIKLALSPQA
jgi:hypothetical protein